ncbi:MerR family transcriptional regulator [Magnetospirillum sp. UT-4]|uniref:MerR family transcriptional regulator n=1 Tax=Magnetospirillum sp. UT-4 TaxID=2681467 RepID=UPI00137EBDE4|nr:MerR family transcriptional regulator [Magnetospirillum sp. UT-4]CAA7617867.1 Transcriptional regulator, MerR family [Magnetospirillum sp. UT-4]
MTAEGEGSPGRRNGKSETAFRTISEVAEDLDVPQHVLRFWEGKFPQVKPLKRAGGRRYYRPEDVTLLRRIRDLLYSEGYTIKGVQKLLREGGHREAAAPAPAPQQARLDLPEEAGAEQEPEPDPEPEEDETPPEDVPETFDDGEEGGEAADVDDVGEPSARPLDPALRRDLEAVLEELEDLRLLLQPRER